MKYRVFRRMLFRAAAPVLGAGLALGAGCSSELRDETVDRASSNEELCEINGELVECPEPDEAGEETTVESPCNNTAGEICDPEDAPPAQEPECSAGEANCEEPDEVEPDENAGDDDGEAPDDNGGPIGDDGTGDGNEAGDDNAASEPNG
jgi:hypothetical protein